MKRIAIDVNPVVPYYVTGRLNGIGRTCKELVQALNDNWDYATPFEVVLFSQNMKGVGARDLGTSFHHKHLYVPFRDKFNKWVNRIRLREILLNYDLMHITSNYADVAHPEKCIVTIHDAMFFSHPEEMFHPEECKILYTGMAQKCKSIITCSESSKRDIVKYMGVPEEKVNVCYWGVRHDLFYPREKAVNEYCGNAPYFISSSCDLGRKNTISVIRAFAKYRNEKSSSHHLILVWRTPPKEIVDEVTALGISQYVHFASNISDESLANLYSSATACFFPSLYEGFGLPVLESMASGTPVLTCDNSSLSEVGGCAAEYTEPFDISSIAEYMHKFDKDITFRIAKEEESIRQAAKFTWKRCAEQTLNVYRKCLEV